MRRNNRLTHNGQKIQVVQNRTQRNRVQDPGFRTTLVSGPSDPVQTTPDIIMHKKVLLELLQPAANQSAPLTVAMIANILPEFTTNYMIRISKLSFYLLQTSGTNGSSSSPIAEGYPELRITDLTTDLATFSDRGAYGSIMPQIHIRPSFELRQQWFLSNDTTVLYNALGGNRLMMVNVSIEIRIPGRT